MNTVSKYMQEHFPFVMHDVLGNTILQWGFSVAVFFITAALLFLARLSVGKLNSLADRSSHTQFLARAAQIIARTSSLFVYAVSLYVGLSILNLPGWIATKLQAVFLFICILQVALWLSAFAVYFVRSLFEVGAESDPGKRTTQGILVFTARLLIWVAALLVLLDNLGIDITALVAGLGVGGIAVALAVQNVLGDMFSSLSIVLDKPFEVGDFIVIDDFAGVVERVGVKTTRLRSLSGEELVFANSDLLTSRIHNYKRMAERRVAFTIGVLYQTPREKVALIADWIKDIIVELDSVRFDRAHFKAFGPSSLDFEIVYYVLSRDYNVYMDIQQRLNLAILELFEKEGVEFAYPTQTIFLENDTVEQAGLDA